MRWERGHRSDDVIDRRGQGAGAGGGAGLGMLLQLAFVLFRKLGWAAIPIILIGGGVLYFMGFLGGGPSQRLAEDQARQGTAPPSEAVEFVSFVLDDVQKVWAQKFAERGSQYQRAKLVVFTDRTSTGCGMGDSATGPFYCPGDQRAYIDLGFYKELEQRFGAAGDFAQAYVLAHEIGHHVQNLLGASDRVHGAPKSQQTGARGLSVRLELQADCYAGVWAHSTDQRNVLEAGDLDEALRAAAAIGDDRLQRQATGTVSPETFSHGTSEQRARWLRLGYDTGKPEVCDTFSAQSL
jgi:uncharacterized protein